tara:strand:+ start:228 stop:497 length:270 start_codon:yes stop_codon:yes gene_type:complete
MKNKLLIASLAISGLMGAQCSVNCDYDKSKYKNKMHEYEAVHPEYVGIFNRAKTDKCCMTHCILIIREFEKDTVCLKHGKYKLNTNAIR